MIKAQELQRLAKDNGISTFGLQPIDLLNALEAKGIEIPKEKKKGSSRWKPQDRLVVRNKDSKLGYRWCDEDPMNIEKKLAEGWHFINKVSGETIEIELESDAMKGVKQHRELILMAQDRESLKEREEYYQEQTDLQERGIKNRIAADAPGDLALHGKITIE